MVLSKIGKRVTGSGLARQTLAYGFTSAVAAGVNVAVGPILTHYLDPADYGIAALFLTAYNALFTVAALGTPTAIRRRYYQKETVDYPSYVHSTILATLANAVIVTLLAASTYFWWGNENISWLWALAFLPWMLGRYLITVATTLLQSEKRPLAFGVVTWVNSLLIAGATLGLVITAKLQWEGRVLGNVLGSLALGLACVVTIRRIIGPGARWDAAAAKDAIKFSVPSVPNAALDRTVQLGDRAFIVLFAGIDAAGFYTLGAQISGLTTRAATAFNQAWQPWLFERLKEDTPSAKRRVSLAFYLASAGLVVFALVLYFGVKWVFPFLIGDKYSPAVALIPWICVGLAIRGIASLQRSLIVYSERTGHLVKIGLVVGVLTIGISALMVWLNGAEGAAQGVFLSSLLHLFVTWRVARRLIPLPWM